MADNRTKAYTRLIQFQTDAEKAAREVQTYQRALEDARLAQEREKAAGDENRLSLVRQREAMVQAKRAKEDATAAGKRYAAELGRAKTKQEALGKSLDKAYQSYLLAAVAIAGVTAALTKLIQKGTEYSGNVSGVDKQVDQLRKSVDGMIGDKPLSRLAEWQNKLGLSGKEAEAVAKAGVDLGRINKVTFDQGLETATTAVVGFEQEVLKKLGLRLTLTGDAAHKQGQIIDALVAKYGPLATTANNAGERQAKLNNALDTAIGKLGRTIVESEGYRRAVSALTSALEDLAAGQGVVNSAYDDGIRKGAALAHTLAALKGAVDAGIWDAGRFAKELSRVNLAILDGAKAEAVKTAAVKQAAREREAIERRARGGGSAGTKKKAKQDKDEYDAQVKAYEQHQEEMGQLLMRTRGWQDRQRAMELQAELKAMAVVDKAKALARKRDIDRTRAWAAEQKAALTGLINDLSSAIASNAAAVIAGEKSLGEAIKDTIAGTLKAKAIEWAALSLAALGRYALSWGADAGALQAAGYYGAAAAAAGIGAGIVGAGGGGGSAAPSAPSDFSGGSSFGGGSGSGSGSGSAASGGGPTTVNNYHLYGRRAGLGPTRKELKQTVRRLQAGRVAA